MNRAPLATLFWIVLLLLCAIGLTVAGFHAAILPEHRGTAFATVVITTCVAEWVVATGLYYLLAVPHTVRRTSPAVRIRLAVATVIWFVLLLILGAVAVAPVSAGSRFSQHILLIQAIPTFFLLAAVYFLGRQDVVLQVRQEIPQRDRGELQACAATVDAMIESIRRIADRCPQNAVALDRLGRQLDTLKTQLLCVSPVSQRDSARTVEPIPVGEIQHQLERLHQGVQRLADSGDESLDARLAELRRSVDAAIGSLRRREDVITH
jgi:hypothetical protein